MKLWLIRGIKRTLGEEKKILEREREESCLVGDLVMESKLVSYVD